MGRGWQRVPRLPVRDLGDEPRPLPPARRRGGARAGGGADARVEPLLQRARDAPRRAPVAHGPGRQGVPLQLGHRGERGGDQARAQGAPGRRHRGPARRLPRADLRRALGHAAGVQAGSLRAARARVSHGRGVSGGARDDGRRAHGGGAGRADPGRDRRARRRGGRARGRARGVRPARRSADLRRDPEWDGAHGHAVGVRAVGGASRRVHLREGARRRPAGGRAGDGRAPGRRVRAG